MKAPSHRTHVALFVCLLLLFNTSFSQTQGRVVINEYMTWPSSGCGTATEFVELLNFGPGPVDIGCYVLTTGVYSITIPPHTIIQPGQYFVLAGRDRIPGNCANIDSTATGVRANLNWNTCNCTNVPIPQTGAGMLSDGGSANTPLVLLDPSLNIIDAVVRNIPTEPVGPVTTAAVPGGCPAKTFNIGTMNPAYEVLGMSAGRANSFARTMDGDCNWVKDNEQSAGASNNRSGDNTAITYVMNIINPCVVNTNSGSVSIYVNYTNYAEIFPMHYTLVRDANGNGTFDIDDEYSTGTDATAPYIELNNLPVGNYRVTVGSTKGCFLRSFDFVIMSCNPGVLATRLVYFRNKILSPTQHQLDWQLEDVQNLQSLELQKGDDEGNYTSEKLYTGITGSGSRQYSQTVPAQPPFTCYRLKLVHKNGQVSYSTVLNLAPSPLRSGWQIGPNPATDGLNLQVRSAEPKSLNYVIYNSGGRLVSRGSLKLVAGDNRLSIGLQALAPGTYQLQSAGDPGNQPISFRFVKQ